MERSAQEEKVGEFEKAELAIKEFEGAEIVEMETAAKEEEERAEKKERRNSTMKWSWRKPNQSRNLNMKRKPTRKEIKQIKEQINVK